MAKANARAKGLRFETILVPHDFTAASNVALDYAAEFADPGKGVIHLLHVCSPAATIGPLESALPLQSMRRIRDDQSDAESRLLEVSARLDVPVENHVAIGSPAAVICKTAEEIGADLIVMGATARRGVGGVFQGGVVMRTVRRASCPVFTVQPHDVNARR